MPLKVGMKCRRNLSFEAGNGTPMPFSPEARGIINGLRNPDRAPGRLLEAVSFRRGDRREISLKEVPLARISRALSSSRSVGLTDVIDEWIEAADQQR